MNQVKTRLFLVIAALLLIILVDGSLTQTIRGLGPHQTVPTRTSTPLPPTATATQGSGGGPQATNTPIQQASPTSTLLPVTFAPTPVGGFIATAVPCSGNPTIQTRGATNVRSGPGTAYPVIGELVYLEVRFIIGRGETTEWWLIQFNNGQTGWVADEVVNVQGYTPIIPIVPAPPLANGTATPGPLWNPTAIPFCTVTPIPTETPPFTEAEETATDTSSPAPAETETPAPTVILPTDTPIVQPTAVFLTPTEPPPTVEANPEENSGAMGLLILGVGLLAGLGFGLYFWRRRSSMT